jgi:FkbM family methyltransferase
LEDKFKTVTNIYTGELTDSTIVNAKEIEIIKKLVTKDDVCLDIGANVGFMTIQLAQLAKHVYAFEPSPDNFKQLEENTKHLDNITISDLALSNTIGDDYLHICPKDNGMNRMYKSKWCEGGKTLKVPVSMVDVIFLSSRVIDKINFVKIDVEGLEFQVIEGMMLIIERDHPTIMMEWHPPTLEEAGTNPEEFYHFMKYELGYNDITNCNTDEFITLYNELDKQTRDQPAVNILWRYDNK